MILGRVIDFLMDWISVSPIGFEGSASTSIMLLLFEALLIKAVRDQTQI